jgi:hypothetical protein
MIDQEVKNICPEIVEWKFQPWLVTWLDGILDTKEEISALYSFLGNRADNENRILNLIESADDAECLTSSIGFVRDAKLFFLKRKLLKE